MGIFKTSSTMKFSTAFSSLVIAANSSFVAGTDLMIREQSSVAKHARKLSKNTKSTATTKKLIDGAWQYVGCDNRVFSMMFSCGLGGDPDLCLVSEIPLGKLFSTNEEGSEEVAPGIFYLPDPLVPNDIQEEDIVGLMDTTCVLSGTFRASSTIKGKRILPIPLASSNGCEKETTNFKFFMKGKVLTNGSLDLDFSNDFGETYSTEDNEKPDGYYIGTKVDKDRRLLFDREHRGLCPWCLLGALAEAAVVICSNL